jgi:hypothetical protein
MIKFTIQDKPYYIDKIRLEDLYVIREKQWYEGTGAAAGIVAHLSGCPEEDVKRLKPYQFLPLWQQVEQMFSVKEDNPVQVEIRLGEEHLGLVHMDELTIGELADAEVIMHSHNADARTHELLAILYRPVTGYWGKTYTVEEYDSKKCRDRADLFLKMDLDVMRGATAFFFAFEQACTKVIVDSLRPTIKESPQKIRLLSETLLKLLVPGKTSFTSARERVLSSLNEQLDSMSGRDSTSWLASETKPKDSRSNTRK